MATEAAMRNAHFTENPFRISAAGKLTAHCGEEETMTKLLATAAFS